MAKDDRSRPGDGDEREDGEDATRLRPDGTGDDDGDTTRLRGETPADDEEATRFRGDEGEGDDEEEATQLRPTASGPSASDSDDAGGDEDDEEEPTRFRGDDADDEEEATVLRGGRSADPADEDEATRFRTPPSDEDSTEINTGIGDEATRLRPQNADDGEATRLRPGSVPSDDDPTVQGREMPGDDDPTVVGDEDATVQAGGGGAADDDATVRAGPEGDNDPTEPGPAAKRPASPPPKPPPAASGEIGMGTVLKGRFVLEDKLGAGGMGGVFRAVDLVKQEARDRNPHVAVKVLNENFADHPDAFIALQRESSRTQRLSHPNIASVYDFDRDGDVAYMVMELLKGDPLDKHLKQNKQGLGPDEARSVIKDIASALAYAHAQGLIHSDFKPGNIFFTEEGTAKVFDFGIARAAAAGGDDVIGGAGPVDVSEMDDSTGEDKTLFDAGKLGALTPAYAAIEMFEGREPAAQDDVYALGIVAYQCLTGKHPFDRQKAPMAEAKGMVPQRPEGVSRREWRAIRNALEFRREDRTPDAQAFLDEFFGITGQALTAALITGLGAAAVVAGLYFGGVIGPQTQINVPEAWVELDTQISNVRSGVQEQLDDPEFSADDQFVAWEGVIQRDIDQWARIASPKLVVAQTFPNEEAAQDFRMQAFEQTGVVLRIQPPSAAGGDYRLVAGPWSGPEAEARRQATRDDLESLGIDHSMITDEAAIAEARDDALDVYLDEFRRRLPDAAPPTVGAVVQTDEGILRGRPGEERIEQALEAGGFWIPDPEAEAEVQEGLLQIRTAETVLSRARENFDVSERSADLTAAERELQATREAWQSATQRGQQLASTRQSQFNVAQQTFEDQQARQAEIEALYDAKVSGGSVDLLYTIEGDQVVESTHPGVYRVFRLQCQDVDLVREAIEDFPDLRPEDQRQAVTYAADCMNGKVGNYTESVLRTRDLIVDAARAEGIEASMVAAIERPDPCSNIGYVGAGRSAFCVDELDAGGAAPPVVVVPGTTRGENYGIGKFEVSVGDWNAFCAATGCERRPGPARAPVTGVSPEEAREYTDWLSAQTGRSYRLPTAEEWRHAATADGADLDPNRNCYSNVRGVIRGEDLVTVGQGAPNAWGLVNHVGNAQELARTGDGPVLVGGRHLDPLTQCTVSSTRDYDGAPDPTTGFRVLREIGS